MKAVDFRNIFKSKLDTASCYEESRASVLKTYISNLEKHEPARHELANRDTVVDGAMVGSYVRTDYKFAPSQWETSLQSNAVSHWLGANLESAQCVLTLVLVVGIYIEHGQVILSHSMMWDVTSYPCTRYPHLAPKSTDKWTSSNFTNHSFTWTHITVTS